jgi:hypothetical protein
METKRSENEEMKRIVVTMMNTVVIVAGVVALLKLSKVMVGDLKDMGL